MKNKIILTSIIISTVLLSNTVYAKSHDLYALYLEYESSQMAPPMPENSEVQIVGSDYFKKEVSTILNYLKQYAKSDYEIYRRYVGKVQEAARVGFGNLNKPPTSFINYNTIKNLTLASKAAAFMHEACHSVLYFEHVYHTGLGGPEGDWTFQEEELCCIQKQIQVAEDFRAPENEISYLRKADGMHFDTNKDGKNTREDYLQRTW